MAFVFHGIGTTVYGERDYWPDGSFVTTEWFVVAWVPIFPIISKRISYTRNSDYATYDRSGYWVYEMLPLARAQVLSVYGWFVAILAPLLLWSQFQDPLTKMIGNEDWAAGVCLFVSAAAFVFPYFLRRWVKWRKVQEWKRQALGLPPVEM
jgi:hypothetical protein